MNCVTLLNGAFYMEKFKEVSCKKLQMQKRHLSWRKLT